MKRRLLLTQSMLLLTGCILAQPNYEKFGKLVVGIVTYGESKRSIDQYQRFIKYLEQTLKALIELEPAYNELKAVERIERQSWSVVFAPAGLAAIAVSKANYLPIFPLQEANNASSVLVVREDSPLQKIADVNGQRLGLGQPGSATGYYVPLYNLYGTTMAEIRIAPTPETLLEWVAKQEVTVGALAKSELEQYRSKFPQIKLRIIHTSHPIPPGAVLVSPSLEQTQQKLIQERMDQAVPAIAQEAGYVTNAQPPTYKTLIACIEKVKLIETHIHEKPAPLYRPGEFTS